MCLAGVTLLAWPRRRLISWSGARSPTTSPRYVCVYECMSVCTYFTYVSVHTHTHVYTYTYIYIYIYTLSIIHIYIKYLCAYVDLMIRRSLPNYKPPVCVCMSVYVCVHTHICIHTYIYTHTHEVFVCVCWSHDQALAPQLQAFCMCVYECVHVFYVCVHTHTCIHTYMHIYIQYLCASVDHMICPYFTYVYIHTYIHIH